MSKPTARNALALIGVWTLSGMIAWLLQALVIVFHNRMMFSGAAGTLIMWLWEGLPRDVVAAFAAITLVWANPRKLLIAIIIN